MDYQELLKNISPFIKKNLIILALGAIGLILFIYGLIALFAEANFSEQVVFEQDKSLVSEGSDSISGIKIAVDIEGAILKPGVYKISPNSRLQDVLSACGGLSADADRDWVAKNLNLAQKVTDGAKFYIPKIGESGDSKKDSVPSSIGQQSSDKIDINTANAKDLDTLPGIGEVTAQKIIDSRPYGSVDDLINKKVISQKVFGQIKDKISVY